MFPISLEDKIGTIKSLANAIRRQIQTQYPLNTFKLLFVSEEKHCLNFEGFIKDVALSFQQRYIIAGLIFW